MARFGGIREISASDLVVWRTRIPKVKRADHPDALLPDPVVVGDCLIATTCSPGLIVCLDCDTGAIRWQVASGYLLGSPPVLAPQARDGNGLVLTGGPTRLVALAVEDGSIVWEWVPKVTGTEKFYSYPVIDGDRVWLADREGNLTSLALESGAPLSKTRVAPMGVNANGTPLVFGDRILVATNQGKAIGCDRETGKKIWARKIGGPCIYPLQSDGTSVWAQCADGLYGFDPGSGKPIPRLSPAEVLRSAVLTPHGWALHVAGEEIPHPDYPGMRFQPERLALWSDRTERWSLEYDPWPLVGIGLDPAGDLLYECTMQGLGIVDLATGRRLAVIRGLAPDDYAYPNDRVRLPARTGDTLYLLHDSGDVIALQMPAIR